MSALMGIVLFLVLTVVLFALLCLLASSLRRAAVALSGIAFWLNWISVSMISAADAYDEAKVRFPAPSSHQEVSEAWN
jgi:hypothetical protein